MAGELSPTTIFSESLLVPSRRTATRRHRRPFLIHMAYEPPFPTPLTILEAFLWNLFKRGRRSWLATLYEGSGNSGKMLRVRLPGVDLFLVKFPDLIK